MEGTTQTLPDREIGWLYEHKSGNGMALFPNNQIKMGEMLVITRQYSEGPSSWD